MRREDEYRQLANSVRERAGDEESALLRAQWEILAGTYVRLADQSANTRQPKKIDDTGTRSVGSFANRVALESHLNLSRATFACLKSASC